MSREPSDITRWNELKQLCFRFVSFSKRFPHALIREAAAARKMLGPLIECYRITNGCTMNEFATVLYARQGRAMGVRRATKRNSCVFCVAKECSTSASQRRDEIWHADIIALRAADSSELHFQLIKLNMSARTYSNKLLLAIESAVRVAERGALMPYVCNVCF